MIAGAHTSQEIFVIDVLIVLTLSYKILAGIRGDVFYPLLIHLFLPKKHIIWYVEFPGIIF